MTIRERCLFRSVLAQIWLLFESSINSSIQSYTVYTVYGLIGLIAAESVVVAIVGILYIGGQTQSQSRACP